MLSAILKRNEFKNGGRISGVYYLSKNFCLISLAKMLQTNERNNRGKPRILGLFYRGFPRSNYNKKPRSFEQGSILRFKISLINLPLSPYLFALLLPLRQYY